MVTDLLTCGYFKLRKSLYDFLKTIRIADKQFKLGSKIFEALCDAGIMDNVHVDIIVINSHQGYVLQHILDVPAGRLKIGINKNGDIYYTLEMYHNNRTSYIGERDYTFDQFTCALPSIIKTCESMQLNFFKPVKQLT